MSTITDLTISQADAFAEQIETFRKEFARILNRLDGYPAGEKRAALSEQARGFVKAVRALGAVYAAFDELADEFQDEL